MADSPETPHEIKRFDKEYEDPHYHDEDDAVPPDDSQPRTAHLPSHRKPLRRIPPPKRRFLED